MTTPPGWYPDPNGQRRYWTGTGWGPAAASVPSAVDKAKPLGIGPRLAIGFVIGLAVLGGCFGLAKNNGSSPSSKIISSSSVDREDDEFIAALAARGVVARGDSDRDFLIATGRGLCLILTQQGGDTLDVLAYVSNAQAGRSSEQRAALTTTAMSTYCPGWTPK